jgi:LPXTG-site transpeptidase (sortase) family protein
MVDGQPFLCLCKGSHTERCLTDVYNGCMLKKMLQSRWLSSGLIIAGLFLLGLSYYQQISQELWYWWTTRQGTYITVDPTLPDSNNKVVTLTPASKEYGLVIEKIGVNVPVAADVNPFKANEYLPVLEKTPVAEASGGVEPGQSGTVYLFGHSTVNLWEIGKYKAPFTLLNKLEDEDRVVVFHKGQRFNYRVTAKKVVAPTEVGILTEVREVPTLILQTCDPPGENTKRLVIYAELEQDSITTRLR